MLVPGTDIASIFETMFMITDHMYMPTLLQLFICVYVAITVQRDRASCTL